MDIYWTTYDHEHGQEMKDKYIILQNPTGTPLVMCSFDQNIGLLPLVLIILQ